MVGKTDSIQVEQDGPVRAVIKVGFVSGLWQYVDNVPTNVLGHWKIYCDFKRRTPRFSAFHCSFLYFCWFHVPSHGAFLHIRWRSNSRFCQRSWHELFNTIVWSTSWSTHSIPFFPFPKCVGFSCKWNRYHYSRSESSISHIYLTISLLSIGVWGEAVRVVSGLRRDATAPVLNAQFNGTPAPPLDTWPSSVTSELDQLAVCLSGELMLSYLLLPRSGRTFHLSNWRHPTFPSASALTRVRKPTGLIMQVMERGPLDWDILEVLQVVVWYLGCEVHHSWCDSLIFFSESLPDFWQGAPRSLDIRGAGSDTANVTIWAWSPQAPAMDMRHYDTVPHGVSFRPLTRRRSDFFLSAWSIIWRCWWSRSYAYRYWTILWDHSSIIPCNPKPFWSIQTCRCSCTSISIRSVYL